MPWLRAARGLASVTGWPRPRIWPWTGAWTRAMIFISGDLPAPFSPSSACTEPGRRRNCPLSSAPTPGKDLLTPRTCSMQAGPGGTGGRPPPVGAGRSGVAMNMAGSLDSASSIEPDVGRFAPAGPPLLLVVHEIGELLRRHRHRLDADLLQPGPGLRVRERSHQFLVQPREHRRR